MKAILFKTLRSGVCLLLAFCLAVGMCPVNVFAMEAEKNNSETEDTIRYVSLGDSMTNGYGLPGYNHNGYLHSVPESYPALFAQYFDLELTPMAMSGMRAEDMYFILEYPCGDPEAAAIANRKPEQDGYTAKTHGPNYAVKWWTEVHGSKWNAKFSSGDFTTWQECIQGRFWDGYYDVLAQSGLGYGSGTDNVVRTFQEKIAEADIISVAVGNANFGVFLRDCVLKALEGKGEANAWFQYDRVLAECDPQIRSVVQKIRSGVELAAESSGLEVETATALLDALTYTLLSYLTNYQGMIDAIMEWNPDAEVIILGLINTMDGLKFKYNGTLLDMGAYMDVIIGSLNAYLSDFPAKMQEAGGYPEATFYYAGASEVNMWIQNYDSVAANWDHYPVIRDRFLTKVCDTVFPMLETENMKLTTVFRNQVEAFEAAQEDGILAFAQYAQKDPQTAKSVAVYKAVENAIVQTYTLDAPDINALLKMNEGLGEFLVDIYAVYEQELTREREKQWAAIVETVILPQMEQENADLQAAMQYVQSSPEAKEAVENISDLMATPKALCSALVSNATVCDLLSLLARLEIGEGIGCHPNEAGHLVLADAVIQAYKTKHTVQLEAKGNISRIIDKLITVLELHGLEIEGSYNTATAINYSANEDSYYVALGDESAAGDSYVKPLAESLGVAYRNLADAKIHNANETYTVLEKNREHIERADLITVGYSSNGFLTKSISQGLDGGVDLDWESLIGTEGAAKVNEVVMQLRDYLTQADLNQEVMGVPVTDMVTAAVEIYAYTIASYAYHLPEIVNAIHEINPQAAVVIVGMYNPLENISAVLEENSDSIAFGEYLDYLVELAKLHAMTYCIITGNAAYVDASAVQTIYEASGSASVIDTSDLVRYVLSGGKEMMPSEDGYAYIRDQILAAMTSVKRISGANRYETSFAIANEMKAAWGVEKFDSIILANSDNFADALAGSYLAAVKQAPIIIGKQKYAGVVCDYVNKNLVEGGVVYVLGGEGAVPEAMLENITVTEDIRRLAGNDRYATNLAILDEAGVAGKDILVATGQDFADSLSASATGLPILLVNGKPGKSLSDAQKAFLTGVEGKIYIIGGESAVPGSMVDQIEAASGKKTQRIAGGSRYETSIAIARQFLDDAESAVVAYASTFPDGLCGGPLAYAVGAPLILTKDGKSEAPAYTEANVIASGYVLGGEGLISDGFAQSVFGVSEIIK